MELEVGLRGGVRGWRLVRGKLRDGVREWRLVRGNDGVRDRLRGGVRGWS